MNAVTSRDESAQCRRSLGALADAFDEARQALPHSEVLAILVKRERDIDLASTWLALRSLLGLLAHKTGSTPRSLLLTELESTPNDAFWRAWVDTQADDLIAGERTPAQGGRAPHSPAWLRAAQASRPSLWERPSDA